MTDRTLHHFTLTFDCDNDAFGEDLPMEVARILRGLADHVAEISLDPGVGGRVRDENGNIVGEWEMT